MRSQKVLIFLASLVIVSFACSFLGNGDKAGNSDSGGISPSAGSEEEPEALNYDFPTPADAQNLMEMGTGGINFQTSLSLDEVVAFYRSAFEEAGYQERQILTVINETTFSVVWDGHPSGQAIVVQGVDLGDGTININVRFEET